MLPLIAFMSLQQGLFKKVVPNPTGKNGYEEYIRAAEIVDSQEAKAYFYWQPKVDYKTQQLEGSSAAFIQTLLSLQGKTPLQVHRLAYKQFGRALDLVRRGNDKPISSLRTEIRLETLFPEFASIRNTNRLAVMSADALLADGNSAEAMKVLLDSIDMDSNIQHDILIGHLVGIAGISIVLSGINANLNRFSERDWEIVSPRINRILGTPPDLVTAFRYEAEMSLQTFDLAISDPKNELLSFVDEDEQKMFAALRAKSPGDRQVLRDAVSREYATRANSLAFLLTQPEGRWTEPVTEVNVTEAERFASVTLPIFSQALVVSARVRTQLRLLNLNAAVQVYKWHWGQLPDSLDDLQIDLHDPLSGEDFKFEQTESGYRLFSKGTSATGEIEMRYRNLRANSDDRGLVPPAL